MKKLITLILILALFLPAAALADVDLTGMTYEELVKLKDQINLAIWNSQEWQEVTVPPGVYEIGVDIPAGHWSVRPFEGCGPAYVIYASGVQDQGHDVDLFAGDHIMECLCNPSSELYSAEYKTTTSIIMENGHFVRLDCTMIFTPYSGKPDLGFK
jgi:hypothetical protein